MPGDVVILPAGTGHQCLKQTPTLVVIGAYPPSGKYNLCRGSKAEHVKALVTIPKVPPPAIDPVFGRGRTAARAVAFVIAADIKRIPLCPSPEIPTKSVTGE